MMTRKQFKKLAEALLDVRPGFSDNPQGERAIQWRKCVSAVADVCATENGRFDRGRFMRAAGAIAE